MPDPRHSFHCLLNQNTDAVMLEYLRSPAFRAFAIAALVGADVRRKTKNEDQDVDIGIIDNI